MTDREATRRPTESIITTHPRAVSRMAPVPSPKFGLFEDIYKHGAAHEENGFAGMRA